MLLLSKTSDINLQNNVSLHAYAALLLFQRGETVLYIACACASIEIVKMLLDKNADVTLRTKV